MSQHDEAVGIVEVVSGLEQAVRGIALTLDEHGDMLRRRLDAVEEKPPENTRLYELLAALISEVGQQQRTLGRIEAGLPRRVRQALTREG